jgi:hypothetical protein
MCGHATLRPHPTGLSTLPHKGSRTIGGNLSACASAGTKLAQAADYRTGARIPHV